MIKLFISIFLIFWISSSAAKGFTINKLNVICKSKVGCGEITKVFDSLKRNYSGREHFYNVLKLYVANEGIKELSFKVINDGKLNLLQISVKKKLRIIELSEPTFKGGIEIELPTVIPLKVEDYLDVQKIMDTERLYRDIAKEKGYPNAEVKVKISKTKRGAKLSIRINLKDGIIIKKLVINSKSSFLKKFLYKKIGYHHGKPFDLQKLKEELESLRKLFYQFGYYLIDFNLQYQYSSKKRIKLFIGIKNPVRYTFFTYKERRIKIDALKKYLSENLISTKRELNKENLNLIIKEYYETRGFKFSKVAIKIKHSIDLNQDKMVQYNLDIKLRSRTKLNDLLFKGSSFFSYNELYEFYHENAPSQASEDIYDENYYNGFVELLREKYISNGFVSVFIEKPIIQFETKNNKVNVTFKIREGIRNFVSDIKLNGLNHNDMLLINEVVQTKKDKPFNPIVFKDDLDLISKFLKNQGYYFTKIRNLNSPNLVKYISDNSQVNLTIDIETGPKIFANQIIIIGNEKTRKILIKRELDFKSGSLITNESLERSQSNLLGLGIFSSVQIKPVSQNKAKTDVLIFVREKDFGSVVFAPGVRTDLGFKLSTGITYNNIDGMNKKISFQGTINRRFDLSSLDDTRRKSSESLTEYDAAINFSEDHIFHSNYDFITTVSNSRKRYYAYDVDIKRFGYTFSRNFTTWFKASIRQQIEIIAGYNATDESNHENFQIGSFTPAISFDFRDRKINPRSGFLSKFSIEVANPYFLSQSTSDRTINYLKYVNRNRFYIPITDRLIFAVSTALGLQENKANLDDGSGYIPNIKVFRLSGPDIVRGYEDNEINTVVSGEDISDVTINTRAYMANIKLEPRFYLSDSTIFGIFYDAGRVFVDEFSADDLRSSVGLSFKLVTPVGTLDIDYGIKTLRKKDSDGKLESPGKLHISIGFF